MSFVSSLIVIYVLIALVPLVAISLAFPYLSLRLRDSREETRDPQLGVKSAYYLFLSAAILLLLFGLTISAIDVLDGAFDKKGNNAPAQVQVPGQVQGPGRGQNDVEKELKDRTQRVAWALVVAGLLFSFSIMIVIKVSTNDAEFPAAKRIFVGGRLALCGVVTMIVGTSIVVMLFQKEAPDPAASKIVSTIFETITAVAIVWLPATVVHVLLMHIYAGQSYHAEQRHRRSERRDAVAFDDD